MTSLRQLVLVCCICIQACYGQITLSQTPEYVAVSPGDNAVIQCQCSSTVTSGSTSYLHWYQQKPGQPQKLLIRYATTRQPGVPERFSGSGSGTNYKLTITGLTKDDAAHYFCQQRYSRPHT
ncbi:hypothetical protein GDO78_014210, partial [Eleutherodactylus coqui]